MRHQGWVIASFAFVAAVACRGAAPDAQVLVTTPVDCTLHGVVVTPSPVTLHPGDTLRVRADSTICGIAGVVHFRWRSSDTTVGTVDSASGLIRARSKGVATIKAAMLQDSTVSGAAVLQVVP